MTGEIAMPGARERTPRPGGASCDEVVIGTGSRPAEPRPPGAPHHVTPYRPDTMIDGWSSELFTVRAASVRGRHHRSGPAPRQDDLALMLADDGRRLIIAVADGVSAADHAHLGATTAVRYAAQWLAAHERVALEELDWDTLFASVAWSLSEQAGGIAGTDPDPNEALRTLATTLSCAVMERDATLTKVAMCSVGDGGIWALSAGAFQLLQGGKLPNAGGITSSEVIPLPRLPRTLEPALIALGHDDVLLVGTDGFADPLGAGTGDVGAFFAQLLGERVPSPFEFARALDFSRVTFDDDRTLVAVWPAGRVQPGGTRRIGA